MADSHSSNGGVESSDLRLAAAGDSAAWAALLEPHRERLKRIISLRLDRRLRYRLDPSDVLQEAAIEAMRALPRYLEDPKLPFFIWLRWLTGRTLQVLHRKHLGVYAREAGREVRLDGFALPEATSAAMAAQLLGKDTRPSVAAARAELRIRLEQALGVLDPIDREILVLRHFEELTGEESARVLGIEKGAAVKRYFRAIKRLKRLMEALPGGLDGFRL
jgi:RNA polymerase sigma-70 factor (ECF subfamily)